MCVDVCIYVYVYICIHEEWDERRPLGNDFFKPCPVSDTGGVGHEIRPLRFGAEPRGDGADAAVGLRGVAHMQFRGFAAEL